MISSKAQTTIPQSVRTALHLSAGDTIANAIEDARVIITNARSSAAADDPFKTFVEWDTEADHRAYDGL